MSKTSKIIRRARALPLSLAAVLLIANLLAPDVVRAGTGKAIGRIVDELVRLGLIDSKENILVGVSADQAFDSVNIDIADERTGWRINTTPGRPFLSNRGSSSGSPTWPGIQIGGNPIGDVVAVADVDVVDGLLTVTIDFGDEVRISLVK